MGLTIEQTITPEMTFDQFKNVVRNLRKIARGNRDKLAEYKAELLLAVEGVRGSDKKEARVWSNFVKDSFKPRSPKNKSSVDIDLEEKTSGYRVKLSKEGGPYPTGLLVQIREGMNQILFCPDPAMLDFTFAIAASHYLREKSVFGLMVGPPSSGKTEHIELVANIPESKLLDTLTPRTLMSLYKDEDTGESMALLKRYPNPLFLYEDFGSVLSQNPNDRKAVLSQLMRLYDGKLTNDTGVGSAPPWLGHATLIAGVTNEVYDYFLTMEKMGPRMIFLQVDIPNRDGQAQRAVQKRANTKDKKAQLVDLTTRFFDDLPVYEMGLSSDDEEWLWRLGEVMSKARSVVSRDKDGDVNEIVDPEGPGRLSKEIRVLLLSHALVNQWDHTNQNMRDLALRVGLDSLTPLRRYVLTQVYQHPGIQVKDMTSRRLSPWVVERAAKDLEALGVIDARSGTGDERMAQYTTSGETKAKLDFLYTPPFLKVGS